MFEKSKEIEKEKFRLLLKEWILAFNDFFIRCLLGVAFVLFLINGTINGEVIGMLTAVLIISFVHAVTEIKVKEKYGDNENNIDIN